MFTEGEREHRVLLGVYAVPGERDHQQQRHVSPVRARLVAGHQPDRYVKSNEYSTGPY